MPTPKQIKAKVREIKATAKTSPSEALHLEAALHRSVLHQIAFEQPEDPRQLAFLACETLTINLDRT